MSGRAGTSVVRIVSVLILIAGLLAIAAPVLALGPIDLAVGATGSYPWFETGIMPGFSNTSFIDLRNNGTMDGTLYIWLDNVSEVNPRGNGTALGTYLQLNVSNPRLNASFALPANVYAFPRAPMLPRRITLSPLRAGETVRFNWTWEFKETGTPQNDAQLASLRFNISYTLVSGPPPPPPPTPVPYPDSDSDGGGGVPVPTAEPTREPTVEPTPESTARPPTFEELMRSPVIPAMYLSLNQPVIPGLAGITVTQTYHMGFRGLIYNPDGSRSLFIETALAPAVPARVTRYADRVEVYQSGSPGVLMVFFGENFEKKGSRITGIAPNASFTTDPLVIPVRKGTVTGSVYGDLISVIERSTLRKTISGNVSGDAVGRFTAAAAQENLSFGGAGCTMYLEKSPSLRLGASTVSLAVPVPWVEEQGGADLIRIGRIDGTSGAAELLETSATASAESVRFRGESPNGTSIFALISVRPVLAEEPAPPVMTPAAPPAEVAAACPTLWCTLLRLLSEYCLLLVLLLLVTAGAAILYRLERDHKG